MAGNDLFHDLHMTFHWSEYSLADITGLPYEENQELHGIDAYEFLCQLISTDKEMWNKKLLGNGYWKTKISFSYKDFDFGSFRVDLGDAEFGMHETVADSLRDLLSKYIPELDITNKLDVSESFNAAMDDFAKDEASYLPDNPVLHELVNVRMNTFLYCISPDDWAKIPDIVRTFHKPIELPMEEKMYFFSKKLPADAVFVRSTRDPDGLMPQYGENRFQLLIPQKEQEYLDDFRENFVVEEHSFSRFGKPSKLNFKGFSALDHVIDRMREDYNAFADAVDTKCFIPDARFNLQIFLHGKELSSISYLNGKGECMRQLADTFSGLCKSDSNFKEQLFTLCKYNRRNVHHMELLFDGLHPASAKVLDQLLPDDKTSLDTLLLRKPELPTENTSSYYSNEYMRYVSDVALLRAYLNEGAEVPVLVARELAKDNYTLRSAKPLVKGFFTNTDIVDEILDAYHIDNEVKKILKQNKAQKFSKQDPFENLSLDGLDLCFSRFGYNQRRAQNGPWEIQASEHGNTLSWQLSYNDKPVVGCFQLGRVGEMKRVFDLPDKTFSEICDLAHLSLPDCVMAPFEKQKIQQNNLLQGR